jgi:hypothetical protein
MSIDLRFVEQDYPALCVHVNTNVNEYQIHKLFDTYGEIKCVYISKKPNCKVVFIDFIRWFNTEQVDSFRINLIMQKDMKVMHPYVFGKDLPQYWKVSANRNKKRDLHGEERRRQEFEFEEMERRRREKEEQRRREEEQARKRYESKSIEQLRMEDRDIPDQELFAIDYGEMSIPNRCSKKLRLQS